ncbi:PEP-CTERM sorting domain-containing protein [Aeoliella sp.]|uniref:PEP-CTERM sorting domain-containing protein n=1 Tax=Aeoliella sp. TaxID=2795800 RepID=UPI003CCB8A9D
MKAVVGFIVAVVVVCVPAYGATVVANLQADYDAHAPADMDPATGIADTEGNGTWAYSYADAEDFGTATGSLTPLSYASAGLGILQATQYRGVNSGLLLPIVTSAGAFTVQPDAASDELAIHPGYEGLAGDELWMSWTSGVSGVVDVDGWIHNISTDAGPTDGVLLSIYNNAGTLLQTYDVPSWGEDIGNGLDETTNHTFIDVNGIAVNTGETLYFHIDSKIDANGDNTGLQIVITQVPEPGSVLLCLVGLGGILAWRKGRN